MMRIDLKIYSISAILVALKKQQVFADWRLIERDGDYAVLSYSRIVKDGLDATDCEKRFVCQLNDEQIREKLEADFNRVRDRLVDLALSPIINAKGNM